MKKIYKILLAVLFVFSTGVAKADFVDLTTAQSAAIKYLSLKGEINTLTFVHTEYIGTTEMFYVFDITGGGHIIISADDRMEPIRAYVPDEYYNINSDNPGIAVWKGWHEMFFIDSILSTTQSTRKISDWDFFTNPSNNQTNNQSIAIFQVGPLMNSIWAQSRSCENSVVVSQTEPGVPVGCIATAFGQIMNYYQHPYQGHGSSSYTSSNYGSQSVNHADANSTFDWDSMSTTTWGSSNYCTVGDDVAQLLYDFGVAVDMDYATAVSGTTIPPATNAIVDHYGYGELIEEANAPSVLWETWKLMIVDEIDASRPIEYHGYTTAGDGHSWVCDGYNFVGPSFTFHMNWGWGGGQGGASNGWFSIPITQPASNSSGSVFSVDNGMVRYIQPTTDLKNYGQYAPSYSNNILSHGIFNATNNTTQTNSKCNPYKVKYYASLNQTITTSDHYLGNIDMTSGHTSYNSWNLNTTIDPITYNIPPDNYYIGWIIDSESEVWERNESNNTGNYASQVYFPGQSDLFIANDTFNPLYQITPPVSVNGTIIDYNVVVKNDVSSSASSSITQLGYYLSLNANIVPNGGADHLLGTDYVFQLAPGDSSIETSTFDLSSSTFDGIPNGTYHIGAYADHLYTETETNENNNDAAFYELVPAFWMSSYYQITIQRGCMDSLATNYDSTANIDRSCAYPDLEIVNIQSPLCFFPPCPTPPVSVNGSVIDFNVEVANNGDGSASPTQLGYYLSLNANIVPGIIDHLLGDNLVAGEWNIFSYHNLAAGDTSTETATFDLSDTIFNNIPDGTYNIGAYADYQFNLYESNESNNAAVFQWLLSTSPLTYSNFQITILRGCTDPTFNNYNASATVDDGSCMQFVYGCMDTMACNYDPAANQYIIDSCTYIIGCTDSTSFNYDPNACIELAGSCLDCGGNTDVTIIVNAGAWGYAMSWYLSNSNGDTVATNSSASYPSYTDSVDVQYLCLPFDCYTMHMFDALGVGWNGGEYEIWENGVLLSIGMIYMGMGASAVDTICIGVVYGCTDWYASNFWQGANTDDGSCIYPGCMDPTADNYDPSATIDDGSCTYPVICTEPSPTGLNVTDIVHNRATINWDNMNDANCTVDQYRIKYRAVGTSSWSQKNMGTPLGSCTWACNKTDKLILDLTAGTTYEYQMRAWYCAGGNSSWSDLHTFTTLDACPNIGNLSVSTPTTTKATFSWDDSNGPYSFVRLKSRVDTIASPVGSDWFNIGGAGVNYPTFTKDKNNLTPGESYRAQARTWCNPSGGPYKSDTWTSLVTWIQPTSIRIEGGESITNLDVYPNPSRDIFNITFTSEQIQNLKVRVLNVIGEELISDELEQFVGEYTKQIDLTNNAKGIYFLEIETDNGIINKKLMLQ